ncbi:hypothetical protein Tco_0820262 [Tanacetum coccineum]|uniref:Tf2-1-like SH3-like domain-containing protein n=1 Tax=Tanacetum coccineum TaxID=301880 RepID=A0ABQ5A9X0_9ASTR
MEEKTNRKCRDVEFKVGDKVFIKLQPDRQITLAKCLFNKLAKRFYEPYEIVERIRKVSYRLALPVTSKIHPVFHVSILKFFTGTSSEMVTELPDEFKEGQPTEQPVGICDSRMVLQNEKYERHILVQWKCLMDWNNWPVDGFNGLNDVVFRIYYNGVFIFDPLRYMSVKELVAWSEQESNSLHLKSSPLKTKPFRNNREGKVLFKDMYCPNDEHLEHLPPLNDEVGKDDLVSKFSHLGNKGMNDAANIVDGMHDGLEHVIIDEELLGSINKQFLARQKKLDKENDNPLLNESDSEDTDDEYAHMYSESEGDDSEKSFNYLSDGEVKLIELRKRRVKFKNSIHGVDDQVGVLNLSRNH